MARKIRFPLKMVDGTEVRTIDELKEHFDVKSVIAYFKDGRLLNWLQARYYYDEADKIEQLTDDDLLAKKLCTIFGVESEIEDLDIEEIERRQKRLNRLKQHTADEKILSQLDLVAFNQEELSDLLDDEEDTIYLCNNRFIIPLRITNKTYIGVGKAIAVIRTNKIVDFDELNIKFKGVRFDDDYDALLKAQELAEENKITAEKRRAEEAKLAEEAARPKKLFDEGNSAYYADDYETALEKFKEAANLGYVKAFNYVGAMYFRGNGVNVDIAVARRWFKLGMDKGDGNCFGGYALTITRDDNASESDKREAFRCIKRATELAPGNDTWWDELGDMYMAGYGTEENPREAIRCYEKGVELGNAYSANSLGNVYYNGESGEKNPRKAFELYKQAVELNPDYIQAMKNLGWCYRKGYGTDKDSAKAFELYKRAAQADDANAMTVVGYMLHVGEGVHEDEQESFTWTKKAAEAGDVMGMKNLAYDYKNGYGTSKNISKAIEWYTKAAEAGDSDSLNELGRIFFVVGDYQKAAAYFKHAAEQGNGDAMNELGLMYDNGQGVAKDEKLAFQWYLRAAEAGSLIGMANAGTCYLWGSGTSKDMVKARMWLEKSAGGGNYWGMIRYGDYFFNYNSSFAVHWYKKAYSEFESGEVAYKLYKIYNEGKCGVVEDSSQADYWARKYKSLGYKPDDGCFITTAVCQNFGKDDDCYELTAFRNFRDGWLTAQPDGKALIAEYYAIAPAIVDRINRLPNVVQIYETLRTKYLVPCLNFIESGDNTACKRLYVEMVTSLKKKFLGG